MYRQVAPKVTGIILNLDNVSYTLSSFELFKSKVMEASHLVAIAADNSSSQMTSSQMIDSNSQVDGSNNVMMKANNTI